MVSYNSIDVVSFIGEEGSRFALGLMGSSFVAGTFPRDELGEMADRNAILDWFLTKP